MLIVLVIISMTTAFVAPRLAGSLSQMNSKTAAKKIAGALRYARSQSVSKQISHKAVFDFDKNRLLIETENRKPETGNSEFETSFIYNLPDGVILEKAMPGGIESGLFRITFYPAGNSGGGEIILADEQERRYKVVVDFITGTVRVGDG